MADRIKEQRNIYRIHQIKLELDEDESLIPEKIAKRLNAKSAGGRSYKGARVSSTDITSFEIVQKSIDGRGRSARDGRRGTVVFALTVDFCCTKKLDLPEPPSLGYEIPVVAAGAQRPVEAAAGAQRPVIVGFGPCGMFAALVLARAGLRPIVLERGSDVDTRVSKVKKFWEEAKLDTECNVQFGEGGAGTFSDGKLNTGIKDPRVRFVLETFVGAGADPEILIDARPHIGTDDLRGIVKNIRNEIIDLGGEVLFDTKVVSVDPLLGEVVLQKEPSPGEENLRAEDVVLAIGHSARDTVRMLYDQGFVMEPKPFSMGVRVEHPQALIDSAMYGSDAGNPKLPPAYYKLSTKASDGRGVYSFCMCPGGEIVNASSQEGGVVTNGMSNHDRDSGFANSGILVDVRPEDYMEERDVPPALRGIAFQEKHERLAFENGGGDYSLPETTWEQFRAANLGANAASGRASDRAANPVASSLPDFVTRDIIEAMPVFGRKIPGFDAPETVIKGIESRSSSPVRIVRDPDTLAAPARGADAEAAPANDTNKKPPRIYPGGEGAGYAGGITSAACDGIKIAEKIIARRLARKP